MTDLRPLERLTTATARHRVIVTCPSGHQLATLTLTEAKRKRGRRIYCNVCLANYKVGGPR